MTAFGGHDHTIPDDEAREFASVISRINSTFIQCKPNDIKLLSFWEKQPLKVDDSKGDLYEIHVSRSG